MIQEELGTIINTTNFYIALYNSKTDTLSLPFFEDEKDGFTSFPAGKTLSNYVIKTQKPLLATKEKIEFLEQSGEIESFGTNSEIWLGVPLKIEGKVTGILAVQNYTDKNAFDESDMELLEFVSDQISISIYRKQMEEVRRLIHHDLLERINEISCMYNVADIVRREDTLETIFKNVLAALPLGYQYPKYTKCKIIFDGKSYTNEPFRETDWKLSKNLIINKEYHGCVEVYYTKEFPEFDEGPFLKEEKMLIANIGQILSDTIEHKLAEKALQKSEIFNRQIIESSHDCIKTLDLDGNLLFMSVGGQRLLEIDDIHPFLNKSWIDHWKGADKQAIKTAIKKAKKGGIGAFQGYCPTITGKPRWWDVTITPIYGTDKKVENLLAISRDITKRKNSENALKVSEEKYRTMLNASPDGILLINLKGIIVEVSVIGLELLSIDNRDELVDQHFFRFVPSEEKNTVREVIAKTMNEGITQNIELKLRKKNKSLFLSEISSTLIQGPDGVPFSFMITVRDISQRKKMEKIQIHADRMANLGEMASGIAHEINQPLNTISLIMDNILYEATKDENIGKEYLKKKSDKIFENITRIRNIIDHVKAFSRSHDDYLLTAFDINSSIQNAVTMISEQFKHLAIKLNLQLDKNTPLIIGNSIKFEQVILNLLSNSKDALLEKKSKQSEHFDMFVVIKSFHENRCLIIEIADNGTGITEEDIEHIMLPFYTTKDTGKGTGLGLSISYQIIKEMNGTMEINNNIFYGTTFKITLLLPNKK